MKWYEKQKKIYEEESTKVKDTSGVDSDKVVTTYNDDDDDGFIIEENLSSQEILEYASSINVTETNVLTTSTISEGTQLQGDMQMDGSLNIYGTVLGNIDCSGNVTIYGDVQGNITCTNAVLIDASIIGNITCKSNIDMKGSTTIQGDIIAYDLMSEASIRGSLTIHGCISLTSTARIEGDISTQSIETQKGAVIKGQITTIEEDTKKA